MKTVKHVLIVLILTFGIQLSGKTQVKIGYTNIELVLAYIPESKAIEQQLATYQKKIAEQLQIKNDYAQSKLQEYTSKVERNEMTDDQKAATEKELYKLDDEIKKFAADGEQKLLIKREELLAPILEKLQKAIDDTASENGYTYVLNQTTSTGVSTILYGPDEDDLTEKIMSKLGIAIPQRGSK